MTRESRRSVRGTLWNSRPPTLTSEPGDEWHMKLEGSKVEDGPSPVIFRDYRRFGGLLISTRREMKGRNTFIRLDDITVSEQVPAGTFVK